MLSIQQWKLRIVLPVHLPRYRNHLLKCVVLIKLICALSTDILIQIIAHSITLLLLKWSYLSRIYLHIYDVHFNMYE